MPRVKRGTIAIKKRRTLMKAVKGYKGARSRRVNCAQEAFLHAGAYAYRDRRNKKRNIRTLWITRINAAARLHDLSYSQFMNGLKKAGNTMNRKMLAELAVSEPEAFGVLVDTAKKALA